jgi:hypothetical protein
MADLVGEDDDDPVRAPRHFTSNPSGIECIEVTQHMNFCLGNAMKYIWRADLKGKPIEDLRKAIWYVEREIALRERDAAASAAGAAARTRLNPGAPVRPARAWGTQIDWSQWPRSGAPAK